MILSQRSKLMETVPMVVSAHSPRRLLMVAGAAAVLAGAGAGCPAFAQNSPGAYSAAPSSGALSQPVVQALPNRDALTLNEALARLARNPRDTTALIDAGNAALAVGDVDAAIGFFSRANQAAPGNPMVKAGLASALVQSGNPFDAIPLFEEAEKAGAQGVRMTTDRALAYDLVGDNARAQALYRQALAASPDDEATRRLSLSLAIAGDRAGAEATLSPLLQRQDKAAWRVRAFSLAILGHTDESVSIANAMLPSELASGIAPYLRYMPRLTAAQQAAAANFGQFPRASEIGQDDPRVAFYAPPATSRRPRVASADAALTPSGEPLGRRQRERRPSRSDNSRASQSAAATAPARPSAAVAVAAAPSLTPPPVPQPARVSSPAPAAALASASASAPVSIPAPTVAPTSGPSLPAPAQVVPAPAATPAPAPVAPPMAAPAQTQVIAAPAVTPPLSPTPAPALAEAPTPGTAPAGIVGPGFDLGRLPSSTAATPPAVAVSPAPVSAPVSAPVPAPDPVPAPAPRPSLADAFSEFAAPAAEVAPAAGAVDMRNFRPSRETSDPRPATAAAATPAARGAATAGKAAPAKPAPPSHPSRIWVQLATGRDKAALGFDWRRLSREADSLFRGKRPSVSVWGQSNRLLAGPFDTAAAANAFVAQLRRADVDGAFVWTSPAGQVVEALTLR